MIVESNDIKTQAYERLFSLYPVYAEEMMAFHLANQSRSRMMKFRHYVFELMQKPGDEKSVNEMARRYSGLVKKEVIDAPDVPGAKRFLNQFFTKVPLYLSSATPQGELVEILTARSIDRFFKDVFGDPPCAKSDAVQRVLKREKLLPGEVVFIGDSVTDLQVATSAGLTFIGRDSGLSFGRNDIEVYSDLGAIADVLQGRLES